MICLNSDCIIDFLKGKKEAVDAVRRNVDKLVTTEINVFEIFFGIYSKKVVSKKEESLTSSFFSNLDILSFEKGAGKSAAKIFSDLAKSGKMIEQNDCLIVSTMLKNGCNSILTKNIKNFNRIKGLKVESY